MPKKRRYANGKGLFPAILTVIVFLCIIFALSRFPVSDLPAGASAASPSPSAAARATASQKPQSGVEGTMDVFVLDVGQGDSIFLRSPSGKTMLVDASEADEFGVIDAFLKAQGVTRLDVVVATHPHSDHIGAMYKVINAYEIGTFYMPDVSHTTATFEKMMDALEKNDVGVKRAEANGESYIPWSDEVTVRILSPLAGGDYDENELNGWSAVLHVSFAGSSILLTGDAEKPSEQKMIDAYDASVLRATVLKAGHHGSNTSSSDAFLDAVSPEIAVISCGLNNDYGHPHKETLARYAARDMAVYRTDLMGTVHLSFTADGVRVETEK
ncbi:MAG: ComEC/Rec2 family competence protein [Clostridiaceae bacterium]|nr:MBL fold metallo-hydrolase [Eubacteriales bacterium]